MGMYFSVTEEKRFLVTFHLEFGTITRHYKHNSVLCYLKVLLRSLEPSEEILRGVQSNL